jgi:hypothetical protein
MKSTYTLSILRIVALLAVLTGAGCSLGMMLYAGRKNDSVLLIAIFVIWVLAPFIALLVTIFISKRWSVQTRTRLYMLTLILTAGSLLGYSGVFSPPGTKTAFVFLVIPLILWVVMAIVITTFLLKERRLSGRNDSA